MMIDSAFILICLRRFFLSEFDRRIARNQATARRTLSRPRRRSDLAQTLPRTTIKSPPLFRDDQNLTMMAKSTNDSSLRRSGNHKVLPRSEEHTSELQSLRRLV